MEYINDRLRDRWPSFWPGRDPEHMFADVRRRLDVAIAHWQLTVTGRIDTGWVSAVLTATDPAGRPVVLKAAPAHEAMRNEALLAAVLTRHVPLIGSRDHGMTLLLEQAQPGDPLARRDWPERTEQTAQLAAEIHALAPPAGLPAYPAVIEQAVKQRRTEGRLLDPAALAAGARAAAALESQPYGICHGDLHAGNVLCHHGDWRVIDGKGWAGPLAFECMEIIEAVFWDPDADHDEVVATWARAAGLSETDVWAGACARAWYQIVSVVSSGPDSLSYARHMLRFALHAATKAGI